MTLHISNLYKSLCILGLSLISCKGTEDTKSPTEQGTDTEASTPAATAPESEMPISEDGPKKDHQVREIPKATIAPVIDGVADDPAWEKATWYPLDQLWIGEAYTPEDFSGRYKLTWTPEGLYLLVEVIDDVLYDQYKDPLELWWDDDCVEIFVDEDNSGGNHLFTHNAFAYHISLTHDVVDMSPEEKGALYNEHVETAHKTEGNTTVWEHKVYVYDDTYTDGQTNDAVVLQSGKKVGFSLAYCDNDKSKERENFIGSAYVPGEDKNQGYINASTFGTIVLRE